MNVDDMIDPLVVGVNNGYVTVYVRSDVIESVPLGAEGTVDLSLEQAVELMHSLLGAVMSSVSPVSADAIIDAGERSMADTLYTLEDTDRLIIAATAATMLMMSHWMREDLGLDDIASTVAAGDVRSWTCCPVCEEIECDDDCSLHDVRLRAGMWQP